MNLDARIGRRGAVLLVFGIVWVTKSYTLFRGDRLALVDQSRLLGVPLTGWAAMWLACGLLSIFFAFQRPGRDHLGFAAVVLPSWVWAIGYWQAWYVHGHGAWTTGLIWLAFSLVALIAAGWQEGPTT